MRWWQVGVLAGTVLVYSALLGLTEDRLARVTADRDRLLGELADFRTANAKMRTALDAGEVRGREDELGDWAKSVRDLNEARAWAARLDAALHRDPCPSGQSSEKYDPWRPGMRQASAFTFSVPGSGLCAATADPPVCAAGPLVRGLPSPPTAGEVPHP
jgi:hypothetical protein